MNSGILDNFREVVNKEDKVYILGDCFLNENFRGLELLKLIPGEKYIIYGNHDTDTRKALMGEAGFHCLGYAHQQKFNGYSFFLCHYPTMTSNYDLDKPLKHRILSLSGHTHSKEIWDAAGGYNVALDAHNNYPVELNEIIEAFKNKN